MVLINVTDLAQEDVDKHAEIVGIEEFRHAFGRKEQIQQLQNEQLHAEVLGRPVGTVEHEDQIFAEGRAGTDS